MFSIFKRDPRKKLNKQHEQKLEQAMLAQRNGDIKTYSQLTYEADQINQKIIALDEKPTNN